MTGTKIRKGQKSNDFTRTDKRTEWSTTVSKAEKKSRQRSTDKFPLSAERIRSLYSLTKVVSVECPTLKPD